MRKALLMAGALLSLTATPASSTGLELAWNQCFGQAGAVVTRTSACTVNTGSQRIIASFRPPAGIDALEGIEVFIDYQVLGGVLPCWWNFAVGQLRNDQLTALHVPPTDANGDPVILCDNYYFFDRGAGGGGGMIVSGGDTGRLIGIAAIAAGTGLPVAADAQQYGIGFSIANGGTVPAGTCDGCSNSACIVLGAIRLHSTGLPEVVLQSRHPGSLDYVYWQGIPNSVRCPPDLPDPVQQRTWGEIKSLYR